MMGKTKKRDKRNGANKVKKGKLTDSVGTATGQGDFEESVDTATQNVTTQSQSGGSITNSSHSFDLVPSQTQSNENVVQTQSFEQEDPLHEGSIHRSTPIIVNHIDSDRSANVSDVISVIERCHEAQLATQEMIVNTINESQREILRAIQVSQQSMQDVLLNMTEMFRSSLDAIKELKNGSRENNNVNSCSIQETATTSKSKSGNSVLTNRVQSLQNSGYTSESESSSSEISDDHSSHINVNKEKVEQTPTGVKLPAFSGKESWKVWFTRFETLANRNKWSKTRRLNELLPRLQGTAGEFVFSQLPSKVINHYDALVKEVNSRFSVIETSKTYALSFSRRNQNPSETFEEYAAELKRLYDKAYSDRPSQTRDEDLLRKFLNGLENEKVRISVEYVKEPKTIDEAVYHAVNYVQTTQVHTELRSRKLKRTMRSDVSESESEHFYGKREIIHSPNRAGKKSRGHKRKSVNWAKDFNSDDSSFELMESDHETNKIRQLKNNAKLQTKGGNLGVNSSLQRNQMVNKPDPNANSMDTNELLQRMSSELMKLGEKICNLGNIKTQVNENRQSQSGIGPKGFNKKNVECFKCGKRGHFARECYAQIDNAGTNQNAQGSNLDINSRSFIPSFGLGNEDASSNMLDLTVNSQEN